MKTSKQKSLWTLLYIKWWEIIIISKQMVMVWKLIVQLDLSTKPKSTGKKPWIGGKLITKIRLHTHPPTQTFRALPDELGTCNFCQKMESRTPLPNVKQKFNQNRGGNDLKNSNFVKKNPHLFEEKKTYFWRKKPLNDTIFRFNLRQPP